MLLLIFCCCCCDLALSLRHPFMRSAPLRCPIDAGNTLRIALFVGGEEECFKLCEATDGCHFYRWAGDDDGLTNKLEKKVYVIKYRLGGLKTSMAS